MIRPLCWFGVAALILVAVSRIEPTKLSGSLPIAPQTETWSAERPWLIGSPEDPFSYEGRFAVRFEGDVTLRVASGLDQGRLSVELPASEALHEIWTVSRTAEEQIEIVFSWRGNDTLVSDRLIHSATGLGDARLPETLALLAGSGSFDLLIDGKREASLSGFWSLAHALRRADGAIRTQGLVFSPLLRDRTVFSDPSRLEFTVLLYAATGQDEVLLHLVFPEVISPGSARSD
jgi:hypothetical protein